MVRLKIGNLPARVAAGHLELIVAELRNLDSGTVALADSVQARLEPAIAHPSGRLLPLAISPAEAVVVSGAVHRVREAHPEYDFADEYWDVASLGLTCELVATGAGWRVVWRELRALRHVRIERRREKRRQEYEADPPSRRRVFAYGTVMTAATIFLVWGIFREREITSDSPTEKAFVYVMIGALLLVMAGPLFSGFMARTQMAEPWIPLFRYLDSGRVRMSLAAGTATYMTIRFTHGSPVSTEFFRAAGELIALLAITLAVEARFSSISREDVPFRGVMVLLGFAAIGYAEFTCLHVVATRSGTRPEFAVVVGVLVGMAVSVAILAAIGPMPYSRSPTSRPLRPAPPTKPKAVDTELRAESASEHSSE